MGVFGEPPSLKRQIEYKFNPIYRIIDFPESYMIMNVEFPITNYISGDIYVDVLFSDGIRYYISINEFNKTKKSNEVIFQIIKKWILNL